MAVSPGQAGAVTRLRSTTASVTGTETNSPPARVTSVAHGGIRGGLVALEDAGRRQHLRAVADGGHGLAGGKELADDLQHARALRDIFRRTAAGNEQSGIVGSIDGVKVGGQGKIVAPESGLRAQKIVDGGGDGLAGLFVGADGVHLIAQHAQSLKRHHGLVILCEITAEKQNFFSHTITSHIMFLGGAEAPSV